jgi:uncharacterized protein YaiI (UPF0178 family)
MTIWIDADNFQKDARALVLRRGAVLGLAAYCVSNRPISKDDPAAGHWVQVGTEDQSADSYIIEKSRAGDLACSRDLDLVQILLDKGLSVINDKGFRFTAENIESRKKEALTNKLFVDQGVYRPGRESNGKKLFKDFADCLDRVLSQKRQ